MASLFSWCFGCCADGNSGHVTLKEMPTVQLDTHYMGKYIHLMNIIIIIIKLYALSLC